MPSSNEIQTYLRGAWRMMTGKADGLRLLDLSADGFWNSFFAMVLALPALGVGWVAVADSFGEMSETLEARFAILIRLAAIDLAGWVVPLVALAFALRGTAIAGRYVPYVVASNWATAIVAWLMLPPSILLLFAPDAREAAWLLSFAVFVVAQAMVWRLTNAAIGKGAGVASAVFAGMFAASFAVLAGLQWLFGLG